MVSWVSNRFSTEKNNWNQPEESAKASRSVEDLRGELESRREAHAEALTSQRQRLVEEHQEELQSILKSREVELQKKLDDQAEVAKREASSRREAEEVRMFPLPSSLVSFTVWNPKWEYWITTTSASSLKSISTNPVELQVSEKVFQPW